MADGLLFAATGSDEVIANPAARRMLGAALEGPLPVKWLKDALGFYPFDLVRGIEPDPSGRAFVQEEVHPRPHAVLDRLARRGAGWAARRRVAMRCAT